MFKFVMPKFIFKVEKWKWNNEYRVYVSNMGHFMDEYKKPIPVKINENGYVIIKTPYGLKLAHRLVMFTWCPTANMEALTVDHLDHNKRNNAISNLEWVTKAENCRRAAADFVDFRKKDKPVPVRKKAMRYDRTNFTMDDLTFGVNGKYYPTLEDAHVVANTILGEKVKGHKPDSFQIEFMGNKYQSLLNRCNCKDRRAIDGETSMVYFKYLHLTVRVKPQEDEV